MLGAILLAAVAVAIAFYFFSNARALEGQVSALKSERDTLAGEIAEIKASLRETKHSLDDANSRLNDLRGDHRKAKEKLHRLTQEKKAIPEPVGGRKGRQQAARKLREELAEALATSEQYRVRVRSLESELEDARSAQPIAVAPVEVAAGAEGGGSGGASVEDLDAVEREVRREMNERIKATKREASAKRKEMGDEIASLKKRLSRALRETDKQRGRADNNEKAYLITKNQLESALDRLHEFDPSVPRPFRLPPEAQAKEREKQAAEEREVAEASDAAESGVVAVEVAEPEPHDVDDDAEEAAPADEPELEVAEEAAPADEPEPEVAEEAAPADEPEPETAAPEQAELPPELPEDAPEPPAPEPPPRKEPAAPAATEAKGGPGNEEDLWPALDTGPLPSLGSGPVGGSGS